MLLFPRLTLLDNIHPKFFVEKRNLGRSYVKYSLFCFGLLSTVTSVAVQSVATVNSVADFLTERIATLFAVSQILYESVNQILYFIFDRIRVFRNFYLEKYSQMKKSEVPQIVSPRLSIVTQLSIVSSGFRPSKKRHC